jgi:alpha-D-ribose 1-methylphosphonate 5-triphosphate synthase subunit PhnL
MIKVKDLSKEFIMHILNGKVIEGFKNVSFELEKGRAMGIKGKSGRGKSSILKCIYRTYIPSTGSIMYESSGFGGVDLARADDHTVIEIRKSEMGFITHT